MPSSRFGQIEVIIDAITKIGPKSVLDVGCGYGKYGFLIRESLNCWKEYNPEIDAIEVFSENIGDLQRSVYNNIYIGEALNILKDIEDNKYDLILAIDILEHFNKEDGLKFLNELKRVGKNVLISTPKMVLDQGAINNNSYEIHRSQWQELELLWIMNGISLNDKYSYIVVSGIDKSKAENIWIDDLQYGITRTLMKIKRGFKPFRNI